MDLTRSQIDRILDIIEGLQAYFLPDAAKTRGRGARTTMSESKKASGDNETGSRKRRAGKELVDFKKTLLQERKAGASVAELARKHGVSPAYIYQLKPPAAKKTTKRSAKKTTGSSEAAEVA